MEAAIVGGVFGGVLTVIVLGLLPIPKQQRQRRTGERC